MPKGSRRSQRACEAMAALRAEDGPVLRAPGGERLEAGYVVRSVGASDKAYVCPGCAQEVLRVPHVVAFPEGRPDDRRHWHTPCWAARGRRGPTVERGRGPRR